MRIDIKSESELEAERVGPGETLAGLTELTPEMLTAMTAAGLTSPAQIVAAGLDKLSAIPEVGEHAESVIRAAERLLKGVPAQGVADHGTDPVAGTGETPAA